MQPYAGPPPPGYTAPPPGYGGALQAPPGPAPPSASLAGPIAGVVGVVVLLIALVGTWWSFSISLASPLPITASLDFGLFGASISVLGFAVGIGYDLLPAVRSTFLVTAALTGFGALSGVVMVALGATAGTNPGRRKIAAVLGVVGLALAAVAPVYAMARLPAAFTEDAGNFLANPGQPVPIPANITGSAAVPPFWGSVTLPGVGSVSWGAGWGWYASFLGAILLLIGALLTLRTRPPAPAPASYVPSPYVGAPPAAPETPPAPMQPQMSPTP